MTLEELGTRNDIGAIYNQKVYLGKSDFIIEVQVQDEVELPTSTSVSFSVLDIQDNTIDSGVVTSGADGLVTVDKDDLGLKKGLRIMELSCTIDTDKDLALRMAFEIV